MAYVTRPNLGAQPLGTYPTFPQAAIGSGQVYPGTFQFVASPVPGYNTATAPTMYNLPTVPSLVPTPTTPAIPVQAPKEETPKTRVPEDAKESKPKGKPRPPPKQRKKMCCC